MAKYTRKRYQFELNWQSITHADLQTLETFFGNNQGGTFTWTDPVDDTTYTVRFSEDEFEANYVPVNYWQVTVNLEEQ